MIRGQNTRHGIPIGTDDLAILRVGLIGGGALFLWLATQVATSAPLADVPVYALAVIVLGALGLVVLAAAGWRTPSHRWRWLILVAVVSEIALTTTIWRQTQRLHPTWRVDVALYIDMASELLQRGENPYAWDFNSVQEAYRAAQAASTPQLDGSIAERYDYPALGVLAVLPFELVGLPGVWLVPVLAQVVLVLLLFLAAPPSIQPVVLFPLAVWFSFSELTAIGSNDAVWAAFIVGMIIAWRKPTLRAVLYGLAMAYKQITWFFFPFLVLRLWRGDDLNVSRSVRLVRVAYFTAISGLVFLVVNLPFMLWDPHAWVQGVFTPMTENLVYLSQGGLSALTAFGYVNLPKSYYLLATLTVFALLLFIYWRHYATLRELFVVMPAMLMWFSYRSLLAYWVYWTLPTLAIVIKRPPPVSDPERKARWRDTVLVGAAGMLALVTAGLLMAGESPVVVEPVPPFLTVDGHINRMQVRVENHGDTTLQPRFGVHFDYTGFNPLPWYIESGPLTLDPDQSALYQIVADGQLTPLASSAAQVVVTDASGNYALRGVATIGPDHSFLWPDAIPNPEFLFWDNNASTPIFWGRRVEPQGSGDASYAERDGHNTVRLALDGTYAGPKSVAINSFILVPRAPFGIWVYADTAPGSGARYGIEFQDGGRRLTLRFGAYYRVEQISDQHVIVERPVPVGVWAYQEIDLVNLYRLVGWELPPLRPMVYRGVDADFRAIDMSLFLSSEGTTEDARVYFGPIEQDDFRVDPESLMAETLDDPPGYYIRLSERYVAERNYAHALTALERALEFAPSDAGISGRMDEIEALRAAEGMR